MSPEELQRQHDSLGKISRRAFLQGATALALTGPAVARARQANLANKSILAYVGTYSSSQGPEGSKGNGQGIYLFQMDPSTGALSQRELFLSASNPAWLDFDPSRTHLYSANETATFQDTNSGSVSAFSIDRSNGHLTLLNTVSSQGAGPAHLSLHPSGKHVLVANYAGGTVAVLPIRLHDSIAFFSVSKEGTLTFAGEEWTRGNYPRSFNIDPTGKFLYSCNQRSDAITTFRINRETGGLTFTGQYTPVSTPAIIVFLTLVLIFINTLTYFEVVFDC